MTDRKRFFMIAFLFYLVLLCSGCSGTSPVTNENGDETENTNSNKAFTYMITAKEFDREAVCHTLLEHYDVSSIPPVQENGSTYIETGDSSLMIGKGYLDFEGNESASGIRSLFFYYVFHEWIDVEQNLKENLASINENTEVKELEEKIAAICISEEGETLNMVRAVKLGKEELQNIETKLKQCGEETDSIAEWEANEYIGLEYEIVKDDIPIMGIEEPIQAYNLDIWSVQPAYIQVVIGNGRILCLEARGLIQSEKSKKASLISAEEAVRIMQKGNEDIISDMEWSIEEIKLEYVAIPDWKEDLPQPKALIPYWCIIRSCEGEETIQDAVRINAVTGGDLSYGE